MHVTHPPSLPAGDPQQLGPMIRSPVAKRQGLETSLLERLMRAPPYARVDSWAGAQAAEVAQGQVRTC
jgi:hypothetical protein